MARRTLEHINYVLFICRPLTMLTYSLLPISTFNLFKIMILGFKLASLSLLPSGLRLAISKAKAKNDPKKWVI